MEIVNFFKFLEDKRGESIPLKLKLRNGIPLDGTENLSVGGSLDLYGKPITSLPEGLKVGGSLDLRHCPIRELPKGLHVHLRLYLDNSKIEKLPADLKVDGFISMTHTPLSELRTEEIRGMVPGIEKQSGLWVIRRKNNEK